MIIYNTPTGVVLINNTMPGELIDEEEWLEFRELSNSLPANLSLSQHSTPKKHHGKSHFVSHGHQGE